MGHTSSLSLRVAATMAASFFSVSRISAATCVRWALARVSTPREIHERVECGENACVQTANDEDGKAFRCAKQEPRARLTAAARCDP
jgi:aspartate carbamoyltransferase regulatory subunit